MIETIINILQILGITWVWISVLFLAWVIVNIADKSKKHESKCDDCEMWAGCPQYQKGLKCEILEENYDRNNKRD